MKNFFQRTRTKLLVLVSLGVMAAGIASANNNTVTLFSSTARVASATPYTTSDLHNFSWRGIQTNLKITAATGVTTVLCKLQGKDAVTNAYYDLPLATYASLTGPTVTPTPLTVYPGLTAVTNVNANAILPLIYRASCLVTGTSITFSMSGNLQE